MARLRPRSASAERRARGAGFTLVELMVVVAITGVMAAIAVALVKGHINAAKSNQARAGVEAIRVAEESFRAVNGQYLDCSGTGAKWYPMTTPGKTRVEWHQPSHPDSACWLSLGVTGIRETQYGFLVNAGNPSTAYPTVYVRGGQAWSAPIDYWYVIQVKGNVDGNDVFMQGVTTNFNTELLIDHEAE